MKRSIVRTALIFSILTTVNSFSQNLSFTKEKYNWPTEKPDFKKVNSDFNLEDIVIIDEKIRLDFTNYQSQILSKNNVLQINNTDGLKKISEISLPESFDEAYDKHVHQLGRKSKIQSTYIYDFKIKHIAARVLKQNGKVVDVTFNISTRKVYWTRYDGTRLYDYNYQLKANELEVGDILEYNYEIEFKGNYGGSNIFYFNSSIAKQNSSLEISYIPYYDFQNFKIVCNSNIPDSSYSVSEKIINNISQKSVIRYSYNLKNLKPVNYPVNSLIGKNMPHVYVDFDFVTAIVSTNTPTESTALINRDADFKWIKSQKQFEDKPFYNNQQAGIRKYLSKLPFDETHPMEFLIKLSDTLNRLDFQSAEFMHNNGNAQYAVTSGAWLLKGKLQEEFLHDIYWQILSEKKFKRNILCIQDKRLGEIDISKRKDHTYEEIFFSIETGNSLMYIMPRKDGIKYNFNEIPFYYEGTYAALMEMNDPEIQGGSSLAYFLKKPAVKSFIKIPFTTENENVRSESGIFNIIIDSNIIHATIKENLGGQFSTICRHVYLNETLDSTVNNIYYKKCSDKPSAENIKVKKLSNSNTFPFKNSFSVTEDILLPTKSIIPLSDWFSFPINSILYPKKPNFDFYFDFRFSDLYNYLFNFNSPVEIINADDLKKTISNNYFELSSNLVKQNETQYLISVIVKVKKSILPIEEAHLLIEFAEALDYLNNFAIKYK